MPLADYFKAVRENGTEVSRGDEITDFRGEVRRFGMITRPPNDASTGRVTDDRDAEMFPTVYKLAIVPRDPAQSVRAATAAWRQAITAAEAAVLRRRAMRSKPGGRA